MQYLTYLFISDLKTPKIVFLKFKNSPNPHYDTNKTFIQEASISSDSQQIFCIFFLLRVDI